MRTETKLLSSTPTEAGPARAKVITQASECIEWPTPVRIRVFYATGPRFVLNVVRLGLLGEKEPLLMGFMPGQNGAAVVLDPRCMVTLESGHVLYDPRRADLPKWARVWLRKNKKWPPRPHSWEGATCLLADLM